MKYDLAEDIVSQITNQLVQKLSSEAKVPELFFSSHSHIFYFLIYLPILKFSKSEKYKVAEGKFRHFVLSQLL